ncbi:MAG TPA: endonuclease/exonuclease/phosphatase family protein [Actinomycetota bacterium]|nr:endonuclease/exonuclease/phosphatase family protein [Actinomycetota bacterium]
MTALSVISFNIRLGLAQDKENRWYRRRDLVVEVLHGSAADVMGLQEVSPFQLDELARAFPDYGVISDRHYGGRRTGTYAPIFFHAGRLEPAQSGDFWLSADPDGDRVRGWDAVVPRLCTWAVFRDRKTRGRRFAVFNTHFDQAGATARVESSRLLIARLESLRHLPRLCTADLNADEKTEAAKIFADAGFRDTFRVLHPRTEANTYHGFRGRGIKRLGKIDYVLCDGRWAVRKADIVGTGRDGRFPSDHFAMTAEVAIKR